MTEFGEDESAGGRIERGNAGFAGGGAGEFTAVVRDDCGRGDWF